MVQYPFWMSSLMAVSASPTPSGGPVTVNISPVVSMRAPVFSWMSLILAPLGPMTMPIFASGTLIVTVDKLLFSGSFSFSATAAAVAAALTGAETDWETPGALAAVLSIAGPIPGMYCCAWPGLIPAALAAAFSSSILSLRLACFFVMPVETSQSPPVPSSYSMKRSGLGSRFLGSSSAFSTLAGALALAVALAFASPLGLAASLLAAGFGAGVAAFGCAFGFGSSLGCAFGFGSSLGPAFALPLAAAFGSAGGAAAGLAFTSGFLFSGVFSFFGGASASPSSLAFFCAALRLALFD